MNRRIAFRPTSRPLTADRLELSVELVAVDSRYAASRPASMSIIVYPAPPSSVLRVLHNRGLVVPEGGRQPVTLDSLDIVDAAGQRLPDVQLHVKAGLRRGL